MTVRREPLTAEDWAWFDRHRFDWDAYTAMEFAALLERARADIIAITGLDDPALAVRPRDTHPLGTNQ